LVGQKEGHPACKKKLEWWGTGLVICLERDADLHMAQLLPLPLTVSCFSKIQIGLPFWYRLTQVVPEKGPLNVCVCVLVWFQKSILMFVFLVNAGMFGHSMIISDSGLGIYGTAHVPCEAGSVHLSGICLSIPAWATAANSLLQVCCCGPDKQEMSFDWYTAHSSTAGSARLSAYVGS